MGRHDEAIAASQRAAEYAPPRTFSLGIAYAMAGRSDEARGILEKIRSRPPTLSARALPTSGELNSIRDYSSR
jgi:hypothetical protein